MYLHMYTCLRYEYTYSLPIRTIVEIKDYFAFHAVLVLLCVVWINIVINGYLIWINRESVS